MLQYYGSPLTKNSKLNSRPIAKWKLQQGPRLQTMGYSYAESGLGFMRLPSVNGLVGTLIRWSFNEDQKGDCWQGGRV